MNELFERKKLFLQFSSKKQKFILFNELLYKEAWDYLGNTERYSRLIKNIFRVCDKLIRRNHKAIGANNIFQRIFDKNKERLRKA